MKTKEEDDIFRETEDFIKAWNKGIAKEISTFFTEDAVRVGVAGNMAQGRKAIEADYEDLLKNTMPGSKASQSKATVRMLTPDLAIWQAGLEIQKADGSAPIKGHVVQVMKKMKGRWLILEAHPKFFPPPKV
jgi:uncharacterized protein (TIGR02246 family)